MQNSENNGRSFMTNALGELSFKAQSLLLPGTKRMLINSLLSLWLELMAAMSWSGYSLWLPTLNRGSLWRREAFTLNTKLGWPNLRIRTHLLKPRSKIYAGNSPTGLSRCYSCCLTPLSDGPWTAIAGAVIVM